MRSNSAEALARVQAGWEALLGEHQGEELALADEIFAAANTITAHGSLSRALTDPSRSEDDRAALARSVFSGLVSGEVTDLLSGLVRERWSREADLVTSLGELALQSVLASAQRQGSLDVVEEQLYRTVRILRDNRDLRVALANRGYPADRRSALAQRVFSGVEPAVRILIGRAVELAPAEPLVRSLTLFIDATAERAKRLVASVTVAAPLTRQQEERLTRILSTRYGHDVNVHTAIDTSIHGGMHIRVGEDVIDGTLSARVDEVRKALGA